MDLDVVVVGAGVVGLAIARELAMAGRDVVVLEAADHIGSGISSRNSEVIHAGIYYPAGSLKARLCVEGRKALYAYAASRGVPHQRCGKLIVATDDAEAERLEGIAGRAQANGVDDMAWMTAEQVHAIEPELRCVAALWSPSTGIIDSHQLMLAYQGEAEDHGASVAFNTPLLGGQAIPGGVLLDVGGQERTQVSARLLINAAGLKAPAIAGALEGFPAEFVPPSFLAKGNYFQLACRSPFSHLVYPIPMPGGLGVHATLDLAGRCRFGPDVEWIETENYDVDPRRADVFYDAVRRYWPGLPDDALTPAYSGIRPKLVGPGGPDADFRVLGPDDHGLAGQIHLFGVESPGLTASLALASMVREKALA